jgi:Zn(2)-Cys(6) binuclear cluster domain-containing protein
VAQQRRARPQLSCTFCRSGKLKCDRKSPCNQCSKRSIESQCAYLPPPPKKVRVPKNTKDRVSHLEGLVLQLIQQQNGLSKDQETVSPNTAIRKESDTVSTGHIRNPIANDSPTSSASEGSDESINFGQLSISHGGTSYVGSSHWKAILDGVGLIYGN